MCPEMTTGKKNCTKSVYIYIYTYIVRCTILNTDQKYIHICIYLNYRVLYSYMNLCVCVRAYRFRYCYYLKVKQVYVRGRYVPALHVHTLLLD